MNCYTLSHVADRPLLSRLATLNTQDHGTTAELLAHIGEVDDRRLYLPAAYSSMYLYCVHELHMSEDTAYKRIRVARIARQFPVIFEAVAAGRLHLSAVVLLSPHLTRETVTELLAAATHKTRVEIERLLAERFPQPDLPTLVQALVPAGASGQLSPGRVETTTFELAPGPVEATSLELAPGPVGTPGLELAVRPVAPVTETKLARAKLTPLSPGRFGWQLTVNQHTQDQMDYARAMLGHAVPSGAMEAIVEQAMDALVEKLERRKFAKCTRSRPRRGTPKGRYVPAEVRRAVSQRDEGRCTFVSKCGKRCAATCQLEFDHIEPVAKGGQSTTSNLRLRCRAHNQYAADCAFGAGFMHEKRKRAMDHAATRSQVRAAAEPAKDPEVIPWLRQLGFNATEANKGAALCASIAEAPLEQRMRVALRGLAPNCVRPTPAPATP